MDPKDFLYPCFSRADLAFERGDGAWLFTADGQSYLDCATGIAVTGLGHSHPRLVNVVKRQASKLWHVSNAFRIPEQEQLAEKLCAASFAECVFFNNSGAEAVETAIKTARRYHHVNGRPKRWRLVTFEGAFHGRTLATVAAGGQEKYLEGLGAPVDGFDQVPFGDLDALEAACGPETAGILIEPIQGESGVRALPEGALSKIRALCDKHGLLLILDEVQTGIGRTGHLFAYQASGITPDILASAKGLGNGFPVAACLATEAAAAGMTPGTHGSTFGGNPLAMAVADEVLGIMLEPGFLQAVRLAGEDLRSKLDSFAASYPALFDGTRGEGMLLGLKCRRPVREVMEALRDQRVLSVVAGHDVLRLLPPLTLSISEAKELVARLHIAAGVLSDPAA